MRGLVRVIGSVLVAGIGLAGCIGTSYWRMDDPGNRRAPALLSAPERFEIGAEAEMLLEPIDGGRRFPAYQSIAWRFPSAGDNGQREQMVEGRYHRLHEPAARPLVIVLPIWGRSKIPQQLVRRHLQRRVVDEPMHVLTMGGETYLVNWDDLASSRSGEEFVDRLGRIASVLEVQVRDIRRLVAWAARQPEVDGERIAIVGFSISAILGSTVMGIDSRVSGGVFVMGGASLTDIFLSCHREVERVRENLLRRTSWGRKELRTQVDELLGPISPLEYASAIDPRDVLLVEALRDKCVPAESREALWRAMGEPDRIRIDEGHRQAFYSMTFLAGHWTTKRIVDFLVRWASRAEISETGGSRPHRSAASLAVAG